MKTTSIQVGKIYEVKAFNKQTGGWVCETQGGKPNGMLSGLEAAYRMLVEIGRVGIKILFPISFFYSTLWLFRILGPLCAPPFDLPEYLPTGDFVASDTQRTDGWTSWSYIPIWSMACIEEAADE